MTPARRRSEPSSTSRSWKSFDRKPVLRGVSLALPPGRRRSRSWAAAARGKTVLLRIIDGLIRPDCGPRRALRHRASTSCARSRCCRYGAAPASSSRARRCSTRCRCSRTSPTRSASTLRLSRGRDRGPGAPLPRPRRTARHRRPPARRAVGRHAEAGGDRARPGDGAGGGVLRRAHRRARPHQCPARRRADRPAPGGRLRHRDRGHARHRVRRHGRRPDGDPPPRAVRGGGHARRDPRVHRPRASGSSWPASCGRAECRPMAAPRPAGSASASSSWSRSGSASASSTCSAPQARYFERKYDLRGRVHRGRRADRRAPRCGWPACRSAA